MRKIACLLGLAAAVVTAPALAGVTLEMVTVNSHGEEEYRTQFYAQDDKIRMDNGPNAGEPEMSTIFLGNEFIVLDHKETRYYVIDEAMMDEVGAQMNAAMKEMEKQLASLPPEQRAMAEQMMKGRMQGMMGDGQESKPRVEAIGTGKWRTSSCKQYAVFEGGRKTQEICAASLGTIDGADEAMQAFRNMAAYINKMTESLPMRGSTGPNPGELLDEIDGFPVVTKQYAGGSVADITTLENTSNEDVDAALFEIPEGYTRLDLLQ